MSADSENKEESQTIRQNLVDEAVKFLVNPNVARHAVDQKSSFLRKKGLSENEIQEAFVRAKAAMPMVAATSGPLVQPGPQVGVPVPAYPMLPPPSIWIQVRDVCNFILILTGASYGGYHLFKNYIGPLLTGRKQKSVEESMIELQHSVVSVLKEVQTTLASLEQSLSVQNVRIQNLSAKEEKNHTASQQLEDIKTEITSLKGLLINRRTFPSTPSMSPSIPSWQRTKTTEKNLEEPTVSDASVPTQDEIIKPEGTQAKIGKEDAGELITDGISGESGVDLNDGNEDDSNPSSARENGHSAGESLSLVESLGESSDEMSQ